jgi:hypothetical protein
MTNEIVDIQDECWSDLHKDVYGCRPSKFVDLPDRAEMDRLHKMLEIELAYSRRQEIASQYSFERSIEYHIRREGMSRVEATRMMINRAIGADVDVILCETYDFEEACYYLNVSYGLADQLKYQYRNEL